MYKKSLHLKSIYRSSLITGIRVAAESGFQGVEAVGSVVLDYIESGLGMDYLRDTLKKYNITIASVNDIAHCERTDKESVEKMLKEADLLTKFCNEVGCDCIQLVPLCAHEGKPWEEVLELTASSVRQILDVGLERGVRFMLEPVAWSPINSLKKSIEFIEYCDRPNFGTVVDTWHLWYGGNTKPEDLLEINPKLIYNIHFCDGRRNEPGTVCDEEILRDCYAGEGDINLADWVDAIKKTGYDGWWSFELVSRRLWEDDSKFVAERLSADLDRYVK